MNDIFFGPCTITTCIRKVRFGSAERKSPNQEVSIELVAMFVLFTRLFNMQRIWRRVFLFAALLWFDVVVSTDSGVCEELKVEETVPWCRPSPQGEPVTLFCNKQTQTDDRQVFWDRIPNGEENYTTVSFCGYNIGSLDCSDHYPNSSSTSMTRDPTVPRGIRSSLTLIAPGVMNRSEIYFCTVLEKNEMKEVCSCRLDLYLMPAQPHCNAKKVESQDGGGGRVRVTCATSRMFPDVRCELFQKRDNRQEKKVQTQIHRRKWKSEKEPANYRAECQAEIEVDLPGQYQFRMNMSPVPKGKTSENIKNVSGTYSDPVNFDFPKAEVSLVQLSSLNTYYCPHMSGDAIDFICIARGFKGKPHFQWRIQNPKRRSDVKKQSKRVESLGRGVHKATIQFSQELLASVTDVDCIVQGISEMINASVQVERTRPKVSKPSLSFIQHRRYRQSCFVTSVSITEYEHTEIECVPKADDVETYLSCQRLTVGDSPIQYREETIGIEKPASALGGYAIAIDGLAFAPISNCTCWAKEKHSGLCFERTLSMTVDVRENYNGWSNLPDVRQNSAPSASTSQSYKGLSNLSVIIIVAGSVAGIVLAMSMLVCVCRRRRLADDSTVADGGDQETTRFLIPYVPHENGNQPTTSTESQTPQYEEFEFESRIEPQVSSGNAAAVSQTFVREPHGSSGNGASVSQTFVREPHGSSGNGASVSQTFVKEPHGSSSNDAAVSQTYVKELE